MIYYKLKEEEDNNYKAVGIKSGLLYPGGYEIGKAVIEDLVERWPDDWLAVDILFVEDDQDREENFSEGLIKEEPLTRAPEKRLTKAELLTIAIKEENYEKAAEIRDEMRKEAARPKKRRIYIASPYTKGDVTQNVRLQIDVADELMDEGYVPFVPLLSHFQHMIHPRDYEEWIEIDKEWVLSCDAVLRLGGESEGADGEVDLALEKGIPVFFSIEELLQWE